MMDSRQFIAYFFLAIIFNVVLFHPLETFQYGFKEQEKDLINSMTEFVVEVCFDIEDMQPGDEREYESEQFNGLTKLITVFNGGFMYSLAHGIFLSSQKLIPKQEMLFICKGFFAVLSPPPDFS
jgi:hypothetical protein